MSLISRIGRRFREKPSSTNLKLPSLPTPREILEDIDSCQSSDSIITLATLIQKKGRSSLLDINFKEDPATASQSHLSFLAPYQIDEKVNEEPTPSGKVPSVIRNNSTGATGSRSYQSKKALDVEQLNNYNKLKQFLLLCEKSEEVLDSLEPYFKRIENTLKVCNESCPADSTTTLGAELLNEDHDVCSSPLL